MEGTATLGGDAVFPVELTLAVFSALFKLTADQREAVRPQNLAQASEELLPRHACRPNDAGERPLG